MTPEAWLKARLTGDRARREWTQVWVHAWEPQLARPLQDHVDVQAVLRWQDAHADTADAFAAQVSTIVRARVEGGRGDGRSGRDLPEGAREALIAAFRDAPVPPEWVRQWFATPVAEMLVSDTLYRSLKDFSLAIPNLIQGLLPGVVGRFAKLGGGRLGSLVDEIERRLDPEVRRFVDAGSRIALERAGDFAVRHLEDPSTAKARADFARYLLSEPVSRLVTPMSDEVLDQVDAMLHALAEDAKAGGPTRDAVRQSTEHFFQTWGPRPLRDLLTHWGVPVDPPLEAWADVTWAPLLTFLRSPAATEWLDRLAQEFREFVLRSEPG